MALLCAAGLFGAQPLHAATIQVSAGGNLQAAINAAQPGDTIVLDAGATYTGNFVLPLKSGAAFITITTAAAPGHPGDGMRVGPQHAALLARVRSDNAGAAIRTAAGAHHWRLLLLELPANYQGHGDIIQLGDGSSAQSQSSQVPYALELDRVYIHGDPTYGQKRGVGLNAAHVTIRNCYIADIKAAGQDAQAIGGWNGPGPFLIENNFLEASGENFLLGGADPAIQGLVSDGVVIRGNHLSKPMSWRTENTWLVKNLLELKNARNVLIEKNVFENNWAHGQAGYAILFTPRNQDGGCSWCVVENVTFQFNIVRHAGGGINILGYDNLAPSQQTANIRITQNLFYGIDTSYGGSGWFLLIGDEPRDIVVEHNTVDARGNAILYTYGGSAAAPRRVSGFAFTNNAVRHNDYGINGTDFSFGTGILANFYPDSTVTGNWLQAGYASRYPSGNYFSGTFESAFMNVAGADYRPAVGGVLWGRATDGTHIGADIAALSTALKGVVEGRLSGPKAPTNLRIVTK